MSADDNSLLENLWNAVSSAILSAVDAYGWIVSALVLSVLFLGLIALSAWLFEDIPFEMIEGFGHVFRWTRRAWRREADGTAD